MKRRIIAGSLLGVFGFILSPLSWWNDAFVNLPLAYLCAWLVSLIFEPAFAMAFIISYLVTNVLGFVLMHKGICQALRDDCSKGSYWKKRFRTDLLVTVFYTVMVVTLLKFGLILPLQDYMR